MDVEASQTAVMLSEDKQKRQQARRHILQWALIGVSLAMGIAALGLSAYVASRTLGDNQQTQQQQLYPFPASTGGARQGNTAPMAVVASGAQLSQVHGYTNKGSLFAGTGYWAREQDMLHQRSDHQVVAVGSDIFILGGLSNTSGPSGAAGAPVALRSLVKYDTYSGDIREMTQMPEPRYRFGAALLNGKIYVAGGFNQFENGTTMSVATTLVYDIAANTWQAAGVGAGPLTTARSDHCCYAAAGRIFCAGGWSAGYTDTLASVEELDPATGKWSPIANMTMKRGDLKCAALNDRFYALGGVTVAQPSGVDCSDYANFIPCNPFTASVERYDPASKKWEKRADMLRPRGDFAADPLPNGRIFVMGGETTNGTKNQFAMHYTEMYVEEDDVWVPKAPLPEARFRFDASHVKDRVYAFGGHPTCYDTADGGAAVAELCYRNGLATVYGFFDIQHPNVYVLVKDA